MAFAYLGSMPNAHVDPHHDHTPPPPEATGELAHEEIAKRAYLLWCRRGRPIGDPARDWMQAVAELTAELEGVWPAS